MTEKNDDDGVVANKIEWLFGRSWRTTASALVMFVAGGVLVLGPHFGAPEALLDMAKFIALGGATGGLLSAKDAKVTGLPRR